MAKFKYAYAVVCAADAVADTATVAARHRTNNLADAMTTAAQLNASARETLIAAGVPQPRDAYRVVKWGTDRATLPASKANKLPSI